MAQTKRIADLLAEGEQPWGPLDATTYDNLKFEITQNRGRILVPVVLSARGRLIDGHHRLMAAQECGRKTISEGEWVVDRNAKDAITEALAAIKLQQLRRQTTSADNAKVARDLMRRFSWSQGTVAQHLGVSAAAVSQWFKANPDPTFALTERVGADGKTYTVTPQAEIEPAEVEAPKAKKIRDRTSPAAAVRREVNRYLAELTNPQFAEWVATHADPSEAAELAVTWRLIAESAGRIADALEAVEETLDT